MSSASGMLVLNSRLERSRQHLWVEADKHLSSAGMEGVLVVSRKDPARSDPLEACLSPVKSSICCGTRFRSADKGWRRNEILCGEAFLPEVLARRDCGGICAQPCMDGEESRLWRPRR